MASDLAAPKTDTPLAAPSGQTFRVSKAATFEAAHYMGHKAEGHPYKHVHGHSFRVEITIAGQVKPGEEWVQDFGDVTAALEGVAGRLDHTLLNEIPGLEVPTLERLCLWIANALKPALPGLAAVEVSRPSLNERVVLEL
ncbi:MAG: 6-carboxytetrahydropterin synthase [Pseudomonadota bacterium]